MAEKQLTVAELMARAQQENPDTDAEGQPRRRRRRPRTTGRAGRPVLRPGRR